ncbi:MAG TPA: ATP-binding protein, partial [Lysobacter sp.]|nr:ATP-binding protein [Lysobacter sp.]
QSERMAQTIDKLLALANVEHRQRLERTEPVRLAEVAEEAARQAATRLEARGLTLRIDAAVELPALSGDPVLLRQAIANLLDNAADFAPAGSTVELRVGADTGGQWVEVGDRGPGVPDYALPRVFERFYSLPRPDGGSRSSGLGLPFVAEVAALHGGRAELRNREGGGALARLTLAG